jgi:pyruvate dehydrogenase E1 component
MHHVRAGFRHRHRMGPALSRLGKHDGSSAYLRLSTRPIDQKMAQVPTDPVARERRRKHLVAGGYVLRRADDARVTIAAMGAVVPEAIAAANRLTELGTPADVLCITSPGLLFDAVQARRGMGTAPDWILNTLLPASQARPMVTVLDGHPHTLAFLATVHGVPATHLGVRRFGQSGDLASVYRYHEIDDAAIARAAMDLID